MKKLVRDKIPQIVGDKATFRAIENDTEYYQMLNNKLKEELDEVYDEVYRNNKLGIIEELGDVLEVIYSIAEYHGIKREVINSSCSDKNERRGGFAHRILMEK